MKDFIKAMDNLPFIAKVILCVPALDIIWAIYRIVKGITKESLVQLIVGILWIVAIFQSYNADVVLSEPYTLNVEHYVSMSCVALSIICSISGCILGFIKRDKNYKKVVF